MEFALVNGTRAAATPKLRGTCPACDGEMRAKCGRRVVWHWAHATLQHCDPWWENETPWHRAWKARFPAGWREQVLFDAASGMKHVADVRTETGWTIEFQNSPMSLEERDQREQFYQKLIWIVNAQTFASSFHILEALPPPDAEFVRDIVFFPARVDSRFRGFWRISENPDHAPDKLVLVHSIRDIQAQIRELYEGHHWFDWQRPRTVWETARAPVFLDFGAEDVWQLTSYDNRGLRCVRRHNKDRLVDMATSGTGSFA